jgi:phospholipid-translocating ATPase
MRLPIRYSQKLPSDEALYHSVATVIVEPPHKHIYRFEGRVSWNNNSLIDSCSLDNTLWMNCIVASQGSVIALVLYTGSATRAVMNTSFPSTKIGLLDLEINKISKVNYFYLCL